jgi:predicted small metal-binding protein
MPSMMNCSVKISADSEKELLEASVQHAVSIHGEKDTPHLREIITASMENEIMN